MMHIYGVPVGSVWKTSDFCMCARTRFMRICRVLAPPMFFDVLFAVSLRFCGSFCDLGPPVWARRLSLRAPLLCVCVGFWCHSWALNRIVRVAPKSAFDAYLWDFGRVLRATLGAYGDTSGSEFVHIYGVFVPCGENCTARRDVFMRIYGTWA